MVWFTLLAGLVLVTFGAESLVRGAVRLATRLGLSPMFIGMTIVGFGTSTPELGASLTASARGVTDISVGNVVGSNIFNIAFILGITAALCPIRVVVREIRADMVVMLLAAFVPLAAVAGGAVTGWMGGLMLLGLAAFVTLGYRRAKRAPADDQLLLERELGTVMPPRAGRAWLSVLLVALGLAMLVGGSVLFVDSARTIATGFGVSDLVIGLTIVAAGTSLPELATSVVAAYRKSPDIAVGNIVGSNIFNILGILGVSAIVEPQAVSRQSLVLDIPVMIGLSVLVWILMATGRRVSRAEGIVLLACYGGYLAVLLVWAPHWFA
jgi:cation:H+ antiporter